MKSEGKYMKNDKQVLKLVITDFISVNHYLAYRTIMKNGKPMAMSYKTKEAKKFQEKFIFLPFTTDNKKRIFRRNIKFHRISFLLFFAYTRNLS